MAGFSYFAIDNMTIPLQGEEFCQAITSPSYIPRILGKSEIKELPNTWTISANGNNLWVIADPGHQPDQERSDNAKPQHFCHRVCSSTGA
jgi:hypothetical protein